MGVLSSVPSQATVNTAAVVTVANGTATVAKSDSTTAATVAVPFLLMEPHQLKILQLLQFQWVHSQLHHP